MKRNLLFLVYLLTAIGVIGCSNVDKNPNVTKFIRELKDHDLKVKEITKEVKEMTNLDENKSIILLVEGSEGIYIEIPEDVKKLIEEKLPPIYESLNRFHWHTAFIFEQRTGCQLFWSK